MSTNAKPVRAPRACIAPTAPAPLPVLSGLCTSAQFQQANPHLFPSPNSFNWFLRMHRYKLVQARALVRISGRNFIDVQAIEPVLRAIGAAAAGKGQP